MGVNSTERFGDRVDNYVKFRPTYPLELISFFRKEMGLTPEWRVADIGAGTGISTELFLKNQNQVFAVEPNEPMRMAAERLLSSYKKFISVDGTSEKTNLADRSIDLIIAAQAFHWFDPSLSRTEFLRILKPGGWVALIWNDRRITGSEFNVAYENLIHEFATDYRKVNHKNLDREKIESFLGPCKVKSFDNAQYLDFAGFLGRLTSSSYAPNVDHPYTRAMKTALQDLFARFQNNDQVIIEYDTQIFYSQMEGL